MMTRKSAEKRVNVIKRLLENFSFFFTTQFLRYCTWCFVFERELLLLLYNDDDNNNNSRRVDGNSFGDGERFNRSHV